MKTASSIAAMVLAASTLLACGNQGSSGGAAATSSAGAEKQGEVLATVGDQAITVEDFRAKLEEQSPFIRARYNTVERKKEFLDNMVRFEVLAQEAGRRGMANDPDVQAAMKKVMVQKLMRAEFDEKVANEIPEEELRAFYEANLDDYVKPERVRVSHIFLAAEGDAERNKVKSEAARLLAEVKGKEAGPIKTAFANSAKERSDDKSSRAAGGDLLFKTRDELAQAWGAPFAEAVFAMKSIGDIGTIVETDRGFHLVKLTGRQSELNRSFESVKSQIQSRLFREKRTQAFEGFVSELREKSGVQVKEDVLARIEVLPEEARAIQDAVDNEPSPLAPPAAAAQPAKAAGGEKKAPQPVKLHGPGGKELTLPPGALDVKLKRDEKN